MRSVYLVLLVAAILVRCSNYDLLDKLENPGGSISVPPQKLYAFVTSAVTLGDMTGLTSSSCTGTGLGRADCYCTEKAASAIYCTAAARNLSLGCRMAQAT